MTWKTVNQIIGLASINRAFRQQLQQDPVAALESRGFELAPEELDVLIRSCSLPFPQLCQYLQETLDPENSSSND